MFELKVLDENGIEDTTQKREIKSFVCSLDGHSKYSLLISESDEKKSLVSGVEGFFCTDMLTVVRTINNTYIIASQ